MPITRSVFRYERIIAVALAIYVCLAVSPTLNAQVAASEPKRHFDHVLIVVLENQDYEDVVKQPYMKWLAGQGCLFSDFHGLRHPSYPNYLAMVSGDMLGTASDIQKDFEAPTIADLLEAKGLTWKQYAEGYPGDCFIGRSKGRYERKHVPFLSFRSIQSSPARCANVVDSDQFDPKNLPNYAFFTPDMDDDGHDTGLQVAAKWLEQFLKPFFSQPGLLDGTLIEITFDESKITGHDKNHIGTIFLGHSVKPGSVWEKHCDHYNVLRTIEDNFAIGTLKKNDLQATPITDIWNP